MARTEITQPRSVVRDDKASLLSSATDHYVNIETALNTSINTANAYTAMAWIKRGVINASLQSFMGVAGTDKWWFNFMTTDIIRVYHSDLTPAGFETTTAIKDHKWHRLASTFDGTTLNVYLDGVLIGQEAKTGTLALNADLTLLAFPTGNNFLGKGKDFKVYSRALTATEISDDYFSNTHSATGLLGWWKMDDGAGAVATDEVGNKNGIIVGATWSSDTPSKKRVVATNRTVATTRTTV